MKVNFVVLKEFSLRKCIGLNITVSIPLHVFRRFTILDRSISHSQVFLSLVSFPMPSLLASSILFLDSVIEFVLDSLYVSTENQTFVLLYNL